MKKIYVKIEGIHCGHCETKIKNELLKNKKIKEIEIRHNIATITYQGNINTEEVVSAITNLDYITKKEYISDNIKDLNTNIKLYEFITIAISLIVITLLLNKIFGFNIFNVIPTIDSSITYGMLFLTGVLTSIHCISMCGAINLMAVMNTRQKRNFKRPILYNIGRVISYTIIGGIVGLIGSVLAISDIVIGIIIIISSLIMFLMSLKMLGIVNLPKNHCFNFQFKHQTTNAFLIGILNGFMPCGPLQAMQIYALSTGNFFKGALSMLLFGLGTIPLMLFVGIAINLVSGKRRIIINKIASVLILLLSLVMLNRGLLSLNIDLFKHMNSDSNYQAAIIYEDYQLIEFSLEYDNYKDIIVQKDIPVKLVIHVDKKYLTGCNEEILLKDYGIDQKLNVGDNVIEFTPNETGVFTYTCWMNMIKNNIKVIDNKKYFKEEK